MNEFEARARRGKALRLVDCWDGEAAGLAQLDDDGWSGLAATAGVNVPSPATRAVAVEMCAVRDRLRAGEDPFEGVS